MRRLVLSSVVLLFALSAAWAQERTVSGRVTSTEDGSPLPGVNVVLKGSTVGTATDADGRYSISVPGTGGALVFSFIGLQTQEIAIGERTTVNISLALDATQLQEVVVTGQGIAREKKALGYATSSVGQDQIAARPVNDISRVLMGKVPGVVINPTGGVAGTGASINIRGFSTLTGSTQPLWVVDGVPFNSSTNQSASGAFGAGAATSTSRFLDLDPNNIESISVLKGLAATVLYGDQGRNGVILVTTKAGSGKRKQAEVSFQQSLSVNQIASLPDFQSDYGVGFQQLFGNFFSNYGPAFTEVDSVNHPYQFISDATLRNAFPQTFFKRIPYEAAPSVGGYFRDGVVSNTAVGITGGSDKLSFNANVAYTTEEGYMPTNDLSRLNISTGFTASVTSKFTIKSSLMYTNTEFQTPPLNGATGGGASFNGIPSLFANFLYTPRSMNILDNELFPYQTELDNRQVWYRGDQGIPNPIWIGLNLLEKDRTNRFFNSTTLSYDFNDNMSLSYRVGLDTYTQNQSSEYNKGVGPAYPVVNNGILQTQTLQNTIWNHDLIFSMTKQITSDLNFSGRVGGNARNDYFERDGIYSEFQTVYGLMRHSNFSTSASRAVAFDGRVFYRTVEQQRYGIYGDFSFDYKDYLFVNLAGRNDWNSALEQANNSIFYPSASVSFLPTELVTSMKSNTLNYLKLRVGYGTSAGFPNPYGTRDIVSQNLRAFADAGGSIFGVQTISNQLGNRNLRPELQQEYEAGFEARIINNRINLDFTAFNRGTRDLITNIQIDPATGFTNTLGNIGKLENRGIEFAITGNALKLNNGFTWDVTWNYTMVRPKVVDLGGDISEIVLNGFTDLGNFAVPGRPTNIIKGQGIARDPNGNKIVGADGLHVISPLLVELGDPNARYFTTLINTFGYKNFSLSFQFDYRHGGKMYASTASGLLARGVLAGRDNFDRDQVFLLPGVRQSGTNADGTPNYIPNDIYVTAADYGFNSQFFNRNDNAMFDATVIRLREISLSYNFPASILGNGPIRSASIILTGNNLWFNAVNVPKYVNFDPEVSSQGVDNGLGFDYLTGPSMRRYGAVLRVTF
jgi:TonB-linked SusC/RagA family outer membrane protein